VLTEAMHLLHRAAGPRGQHLLWDMVARDVIDVRDLDKEGLHRTGVLMQRYEDTPMDLADATLVTLAEREGVGSVLTLDGHFHAYRWRDRHPFEVIP
jgi:uncharacterized protein